MPTFIIEKAVKFFQNLFLILHEKFLNEQTRKFYFGKDDVDKIEESNRNSDRECISSEELFERIIVILNKPEFLFKNGPCKICGRQPLKKQTTSLQIF